MITVLILIGIASAVISGLCGVAYFLTLSGKPDGD